MKISAIICSVVAFLMIGFLILSPTFLCSYGVDNQFSWTISALSHWILIILLLIPLFIVFNPWKKKLLNWITKLSITLLSLGSYFAMNPIYQGDYSKTGEPLSISKDNSLLNTILSQSPNFDGIVCIVSPGCPFCKIAARERLKVMKQRATDIDVAVFISATDSSAISYFISETDAPELTYFLVEEPEGMHALTLGSYPTFVYIKNKTILHKWSNDALGYPALDWIESGLN